MKKKTNIIISMILMISVICLTFTCFGGELKDKDDEGKWENVSEKSLYERGLEVIYMMQEKCKSDYLVHMFTSDDNLCNMMIQAGTGDYSRADKVFSLKLEDDYLPMILEEFGFGKEFGLSDSLMEYLSTTIQGTLISQVNAIGGADCLAAASMSAVGKLFVNKSETENNIYLYTFKTGLPVLVSFTMGEDGAVSATGYFVFYDAFDVSSVDSITEFFNLLGMPVEAEELTV